MTNNSLRSKRADRPEAEPAKNVAEVVLGLGRKFFPQVVKLRRHLHRYPELAFEELITGKTLAEELNNSGVKVTKGVGKTGIVGVLKGTGSAGTVALRADMDALPIDKQSGVSFSSQSKGKMHACGHDAHMAMLIGAARILSHMRNDLRGKVIFIFQPSEEKNPGGAPGMIRDGAVSDADVIFGQHITTDLPTGRIGFHAGPMMASADELYFTIIGKGGHGAKPHDAIDPIFISAQVITSLQSVISRMKDPLDPSVLTIGSIHGGTATNIIPDSVKLSGTLRTMNESWRSKALKLISSTAKQTASSVGGRCDFTISSGYPVLVNSESETEFARQAAQNLFGKKSVITVPAVMGAEDFAYFLRVVPGTFWWIGAGNRKMGATSSIHSSSFRIDEEAMFYGSSLLAFLAIEYLRQRERDT